MSACAPEGDRETARRPYGLLALFILIVFAVALVGSIFKPGPWYAELWKPSWTPPAWVFGPVWTLLYVMIAVAGWLIFSQPWTDATRWLWALQLALNGLWTIFFFGLHEPALALADIVALLACIGGIIALSWRRQRVVSGLFLPYFAWVCYATALNAAIASGNR